MPDPVLILDVVHYEPEYWSGHLHLPEADDYVQVGGDRNELWTSPDWQTDARLKSGLSVKLDPAPYLSPDGPHRLLRAFALRHELTGLAQINDETGAFYTLKVTL